MKKIRLIYLAILAVGAGSAALAQSPLERQLAAAMGGGSEPAATGQSKRTPGWKLAQNGAVRGKGCSITYFSGEQAMAYLGPSSDWKEAFFLVSGPAVPKAAKPGSVKVTLSTDGEPDRTVTATHISIEDSGTNMIIFLLPKIEAGLDVMEDVEGVRVTLNKAQVFNSSWSGGHAARDQMRGCLAGKSTN